MTVADTVSLPRGCGAAGTGGVVAVPPATAPAPFVGADVEEAAPGETAFGVGFTTSA